MSLWRILAIIGCAVTWRNEAAACTTTSTSLIDLGSKTSFEAAAAQVGAGSGSSGLTCSGILGLLSSQYIFLSVDSKSSGLVNSVTGDSIPFDVTTIPGGVPLVAGVTSGNLALASLLSLGGSSGQAQLFINLDAAGNVASGTYPGTLTLRWHYAVCSSISAVGICIGGWTRSAGITQGCALGLCTLTQNSIPGAGAAVTVTVRLTVTRDCRFDADDIDFGRAPFVDSFAPVSGALRLTCTKGTTYSVGLSNGNSFANGRRRMGFGVHRLEYDVFRPGGVPWNDVVHRAVQSVPALGNVPESFTYEARIYSDQPTPPAGVYQDVLVIDVLF
ncbi:spore coat U domain-containing protein [Steroidobacter sp.]|uniref:Csu type fimbrial protein n=1 Tax=Steroidobacter sp. TaxID=1978227 RepID=UPI001A627FCD|nr:spore coat U domain-containing protein [Steroidobacter sp.]MBL8267267.1 spore coat protein U domain-containing protein [Steroidobacter sp.]